MSSAGGVEPGRGACYPAPAFTREGPIADSASGARRFGGRIDYAAAAVLLVGFAVHAALASRHKTPTVDEFAHLPAGVLGLATGDFSLYGKTPPLARTLFSLPVLISRPTLPDPPPGNRMAGWYPWTYATGFFNVNVRERGIAFVDSLFRRARLVVIGFGVLLGVLLFLWARALHGAIGALLALSLLTFDPNILAHSALATVDVAETLFFFAAVASLTLWLARPSRARLIAAGLLCGAALATKFSALLLAPIAVGLLLVRLRMGRHQEDQGGLTHRPLVRLACGTAIMALIALLVVNAAYGFSGTFRRLSDYHFRSHLLRTLPLAPVGWLPVPLPADFVRGFDYQQVDLEVADFPNYLNGRWSRKGWWYYYPLALLVKTPVTTSILLLAGLALAAMGRLDASAGRRGRDHRRAAAAQGPPPGDPLRTLSAWAVALAVGLPMFAACFLNRLDIGVRYVLPIVPFLYLGAAGLGRLLSRREPIAAGLIGAGVVLTMLSTLSSAPHYLAYFNFIGGGPESGWTLLANSNNDWGQDLKYLRRELERLGATHVKLAYFGHAEPAAYGIDYSVPLPGGSAEDALLPGRNERVPYFFRPGLYAISANLLVGLPYQVVDHGRWIPAGNTLAEPQRIFAYFREQDPIAVVGGSILLYRVEDPLL